jgi:undecaprenyl-diphosphatase
MTAIMASAISYFQAIVLGLLQGVTELFPISSLGHTVLFPTLFGWNELVKAQSQSESFWLAFVVMLHVGSALGLLFYYRRDWVQIVGAFFHTLSTRRIETSTERLAWLIVVASVPAGIIGLALEHPLRTLTAKPEIAAIFLIVNGGVLLAAERFRRRAEVRELAIREGSKPDGARELNTLEYREALVVGVAQSTALVAGISRDGVTMGAGLARGLDHSDSARFAFLLATPIILAAGLVKLPDLLGHLGDGVRGQALVACAVAAVTAVFTVRFLVGYFKTRTLTPFAVYCLLFGVAMVIYTQT